MIAVVGATGNTGRAVVKELKGLGQDPLCVVRNAEKAREVLGADVKTAVVAELTDRAGLTKAFDGIKRVFVVTGHNPDAAKQQISVLDAAKAAGADVFVKVSGGAAIVGPNVESVVGRGHHEVEEAMKKSGIGWVILRPGLFMQNTFTQAALIKSESKMVLPFAADMPVALIDVRDTGAVGARIVSKPEPHLGKSYEFTGTLSNFADFAKVFSEVLGRNITYVGASLEQTEQAMRGRGMPDWLVGHMLAVAKAGAGGAFSKENTGPIRDIVGRAPLTTRQFVEAHKAMFS